MARVSIGDGTLVVEMEGLHKAWAMRSRIEIPLANVRGATLDPGIVHGSKGIKRLGTHMPGVITAGSFQHEGDRVFWDVRNPAGAVVIELADEDFTRLVIEVADPRAVVRLIEQAARPV